MSRAEQGKGNSAAEINKTPEPGINVPNSNIASLPNINLLVSWVAWLLAVLIYQRQSLFI